jgi:hypothetical protein
MAVVFSIDRKSPNFFSLEAGVCFADIGANLTGK